jgi:hypothetical protein
MKIEGGLLGKRKESMGGGDSTGKWGMIWSKYIIDMYENVMMQPISLYN